MFRLDDRWVFSARDLADAVDCGHRVRLNLAKQAGTLPEAPRPNPVQRLAGPLGRIHEDAVLQRLEADYGTVHRARGARTSDPASIAAAVDDTARAMSGGAPVIAQPVFFDGEFFGRADFLIRVDGEEGRHRYEAVDAKRSKDPKTAAWVQVAAYSEQIEPLGFPAPQRVHLWLRDGLQSKDVADVHPGLDAARDTVRAAIAAGPQPPDPLWADTTSACKECDWLHLCQRGREQVRHLSLVYHLRRSHRDALTSVGITTIEGLAVAPVSACSGSGVPEDEFIRARAQARLQVAQDATRTPDNPVGQVTFEVFSGAGLALLPPPSPGDVYLDFESFPFYPDSVGPLEYLIGWLMTTGSGADYQQQWSDDRAQEADAVTEFVDAVHTRLAEHPDLHVYHYGDYERAALCRLAERFPAVAARIHALLDAGVLTNLQGVVKGSIRISQRRYGLKYLEPIYGFARTEDTTTAGDSILDYAEYLAALDRGDTAAASRRKGRVIDYNRRDCESTLELVNWLRSLT